MDSLPFLRRELPLISSGPTTFLSPRSARPLWFLLGLGYFSFRVLPLVALPETLSLLRFAWLADWVAVCQPGFYWRLVAYSYLRSCKGAYS